MKGICADLHLCPDLRNPEQTSRMIHNAAELGHRLIAIPLLPNTAEKEVSHLRSVCKEAKLDLATRVDLKPQAPSELLATLRKVRRRFEIVAVLCRSRNVARQAAKDRRVDLLNFPSTSYRERFFDSAEAELAANSLAAFEIDANPLLTLEGPTRIRLLASLRREVGIALGFKIPIVLSSGASNELLVRRSDELVALASLFDLTRDAAAGAVSTNPTTIVKRNREKLSSRFVAPGIRVIRRGKDC